MTIEINPIAALITIIPFIYLACLMAKQMLKNHDRFKK